MKKSNQIWIIIGVVVLLLVCMGGCSYNGMVNNEEDVNTAWGNVEAQYQRRADLIPQLVSTVEAYAKHESSTFENVTRARAGMEQAAAEAKNLKIDAESTPEQFAQYRAVQDKAKEAMGIYINAVHEAYPDLKASENFKDFQAELSGTQSRVTKAIKDFNTAVNSYNKKVRRFPGNIFAGMFGFKPRNNFEAEEGASKNPEVKFSNIQ